MASDSKTKILREAEKYVQQGKISSAIHEYFKVAKDDPDDVLTHNTIGDLYLKQGRIGEANQIFLQVAECYERNNFLLKAIAVYRKILNTDTANYEMSLKLASLYARQGLNVDARNLYLLLGDRCSREGKSNEALIAFEKAVEIDPLNASVQLNLAGAYLAQGDKEKSYHHLVGAARAQMKKADVGGAMASFRRALAINLGSSEALHGFLESALQMDGLDSSLEQVRESITVAPEDPALRELLGRAYLSAGDLDHAEQCFLTALMADESRYPNFLNLSRAFIQKGDVERALSSLDRISSILISKRESQKLVESYYLVLAGSPDHLETLKRLGDLLAGTNEPQLIEVMERIVRIHRNADRPGDALMGIEKILEYRPESEKHLREHRELFALAYPDTPYRAPEGNLETQGESAHAGAGIHPGGDSVGESSSSAFVEVDLLLNYGMKEKALQLLRNMEQKRPGDKDVRIRLLSLYRENGDPRLAAEQAVLLSVLSRKSGDNDACQNALDEAAALDPGWTRSLDVGAFARARGIEWETGKPESTAPDQASSLEMDLSGDLTEIFFRDDEAPKEQKETDSSTFSAAAGEEFPAEIPAISPESIEEQLQEVDFYVRLGFQEEARAKLDQLAALYPGHLDLAMRYAQIGAEPPVSVVTSTPRRSGMPPVSDPPADTIPSADIPNPLLAELNSEGFELLPLTAPVNALEPAADSQENPFELMATEKSAEPGAAAATLSEAPPEAERQPQSATSFADQGFGGASTNSMFDDVISEVNSLTDEAISREDFETHFHLGVAFREMGLIEDAIKEFQASMKILDPEKSPRELIQCCGMLSTCFLEKGMSHSAIRWCQTGLKIKDISCHESMALRYDMAVAHDIAGDSVQALEFYNVLFQADPGYRDVAQKIDHLKDGPKRHAS